MASLLKEIRYGLRALLRRPYFTLLVLVILALGIGANAMIFSVVTAVLIRPLPYHDSDRVVWLSNHNTALGVSGTFLNDADILDYRKQAKSFEQIAAWGTLPINLYGAAVPERVEGVYVTTNFLRTLGVRPAIGRDFTAAEGQADSVIISHGLWQRQFGGELNVIGRKISLGTRENRSGTIVGVLPADSDFPQRADLLMTGDIDQARTERGGSHNSRTIARLRPQVTIEQAQSEINALAKQQAEQFPETNAGWEVTVVPFRDYLFGSARTALPLLFAAALLVLLIACANVANLQLGRALTRRKEIAVRLALGAGRRHIIRQSLIECLILTIAGTALGLLAATWGLAVVRALGPESLPGLQRSSVSPSVLWFAITLAFLSAMAFGILPTLQAFGSDINAALKNGLGVGTTSLKGQRFRSVLVVTQIAVAFVLLTGAGLLLKSLGKLEGVQPGFRPDGVLTAGLSVSFGDYPDSARRTALFQHGLEKLAVLPGVTSVSAISHLPFGGRTLQLPFHIKGQSARAGKNEAVADYRVVMPSFFDTLKIPLIEGRVFDEHDTARTAQVFVVNQAFARTYFPGGDAVGARLEGDNELTRGKIVGVVGDVKHRGLESEATPSFYVSYRQSSTFPVMNFLVRTSGDPASLAVPVTRALQSLDARAVVFNARPFENFLTDSIAPRRFNLWLLLSFAGIALLLATTGVYGVISYVTVQRTREIGIRVALGAQQGDVLALILRDGMKLIVVGLIVGSLGAWALTRTLTSLLFAVDATDPATFLVMGALLAAVALLACYVPARRATKVDPLVALRSEG